MFDRDLKTPLVNILVRTKNIFYSFTFTTLWYNNNGIHKPLITITSFK